MYIMREEYCTRYGRVQGAYRIRAKPRERPVTSDRPPPRRCGQEAWAAAGRPNFCHKSSQVNTLPKAKSKTRSKQNKDMHKLSSVYSERGVLLPVLTSGG